MYSQRFHWGPAWLTLRFELRFVALALKGVTKRRPVWLCISDFLVVFIS
jgi:hypothetical protein